MYRKKTAKAAPLTATDDAGVMFKNS